MNGIENYVPTIREGIPSTEYWQSEEYKDSGIEMILERSMGSQTNALKKPTYKELEKQPFLARITAKLEMNNHDGYCSGDECQYTKKIVKVNIVVPEQYINSPVGKIVNTREYKWANHLPVPDVNYCGSGYCECRQPEGGVGQHEYRYTIKKVEIVENNKYKAEIVAPSIEENLNKTVEQPKEPTVRRPRINRHVLLRKETELNARLEELQKQEEELTNEYQMAKSAREAATRKLEEAKLAIEEVNKKSLDVKTRQNEVKEEIKKNKIEIATKNNKNGYVILAHDYGREQVYGYSQRFQEAQAVALEAIQMGSKRLEERMAGTEFYIGAEIEALWPKDNKWYKATILKVPGDSGWREPNGDECDEGWCEGGKNKNTFDVKWKDGGLRTHGLELHQIRNTTDYNKFNSARIVDLDTHMNIKEYGPPEDVW
jgi:hypothetical protein